MSKRTAKVLTLGFIIGGLFYIFLAAPKFYNPQPIVEVEEKTSEVKPEGAAKAKPQPKAESKPTPPPTTGSISCGKTEAMEYVQYKSKQIGLSWQTAFGIAAQESGWNCGVYSIGNYGMWQINLISHPEITANCAYDLVCSTNYAVPFLKRLVDQYGLRSGLAAYNVGEGGMRAGKGYIYANEVIHRINNNLF